MKKMTQPLSEIKLVGITCRTNNAHLFEADPSTNKVAATVQKYFYDAFAEKIRHRKNPGTTYCVYTDYESDFTGEYTYFIGEEVCSTDDVSDEFSTLIIPAKKYMKFTNGPAPMPAVCIDMWQKIWAMTPEELGGEREYFADFEIYDERSKDHTQVELDIYIGIH